MGRAPGTRLTMKDGILALEEKAGQGKWKKLGTGLIKEEMETR